jgi:hypothetical protein
MSHLWPVDELTEGALRQGEAETPGGEPEDWEAEEPDGGWVPECDWAMGPTRGVGLADDTEPWEQYCRKPAVGLFDRPEGLVALCPDHVDEWRRRGVLVL